LVGDPALALSMRWCRVRASRNLNFGAGELGLPQVERRPNL
jgi:hypothetical protein